MSNAWWAGFVNPPKYLSMPAVGFDLSDRSVKIISLEPKGGRYVVDLCAEEEIPIGVINGGAIVDSKKFIALIRGIKEKYRLGPVAVSLPEERSFVFELSLPALRRKQLREAVELQLEENVPLRASEVFFDYEIFREPKNSIGHYQVIVSVLPQKFVESYLSAMDMAGFAPKFLELETQAVARALIPNESKGAHLIVDIGRTHTGFALAVGQAILFTSATDVISGNGFTRNIEKQLGISFAEAEKIKISQGMRNPHGLPDAPMALMSMAASLRDEISRIIQYWKKREDELARSPLDIILSGGQASLPGLRDYLEASLSLPVSVPHPWGNVFSLENNRPPLDRNSSLGFATAVGLALRGLNVKYDQSSS